MAGDGVSLQTNITQLGNLAKSQSRAQQSGAVNPDQARQLEKEDVQPLEKVRETEKAEKKQVDPEQERSRHRRRRREDRQRADSAGEDAAEDEPEDPEQSADATPGLGGLVDTKA